MAIKYHEIMTVSLNLLLAWLYREIQFHGSTDTKQTQKIPAQFSEFSDINLNCPRDLDISS